METGRLRLLPSVFLAANRRLFTDGLEAFPESRSTHPGCTDADGTACIQPRLNLSVECVLDGGEYVQTFTNAFCDASIQGNVGTQPVLV